MDTHTTCTTLEHTHPTNEIQSPIGGGASQWGRAVRGGRGGDLLRLQGPHQNERGGVGSLAIHA